ncbi:response regulator [Marinobacter sp. SS21]|uniref:response regulator n=1 Tax=Marinobacter sp. SS21 TaxID=2979460 RepID=UPI002330DA0E|nr:response regulator [Marinobacter sp. SS21]MDC0663769.1 response regulator [Marinobacter sp. SS21]
MPTIALIDDEELILKSLNRLLRKTDWEVLPFADPADALERLADRAIDIVVSDYRMPQMTGVEFLNRFKEHHPDTLRIILSGQADMQGVLNAVNQSEVYRYMLKPWEDEELLHTLKTALRYNDLLRENAELAETVRIQRDRLKRQQAELIRLEQEMPGITHIERDADGLIDLSDEADDIL